MGFVILFTPGSKTRFFSNSPELAHPEKIVRLFGYCYREGMLFILFEGILFGHSN